jgi:hypothetical protein
MSSLYLLIFVIFLASFILIQLKTGKIIFHLNDWRSIRREEDVGLFWLILIVESCLVLYLASTFDLSDLLSAPKNVKIWFILILVAWTTLVFLLRKIKFDYFENG